MKAAWLGLGLWALVGGNAAAAPLRIRNGSSVRVALHGKREVGVGVKPQSGGWRLELSAGADEVADVIDVTDGASEAKWTVTVRDGALLLDEERFVAGHAYRVLLRRGAEPVGATLVYLYPPAMAPRHKVSFDDADRGPGASEDIAVVKKPTL